MAASRKLLHGPFMADCMHSVLDQKAAVETTKTGVRVPWARVLARRSGGAGTDARTAGAGERR
mgnify:FL=1